MSPDMSPSRRTVLTAAAAAAAGATLAACGGSSPSTQGAGTDAPAPGASAGSEPSAPASSSATGGIVALADVPVGSAVSATSADGKPIIVAQPTAGKAVAFSAICTHMGCTVAPAGDQLKCPCHGSVYEAATGKNVSGPAPKPLAEFPVTVQDGEVVAG